MQIADKGVCELKWRILGTQIAGYKTMFAVTRFAPSKIVSYVAELQLTPDPNRKTLIDNFVRHPIITINKLAAKEGGFREKPRVICCYSSMNVPVLE